MIEQDIGLNIDNAIRTSVPLLSVTTPDGRDTIAKYLRFLDERTIRGPVVSWDLCGAWTVLRGDNSVLAHEDFQRDSRMSPHLAVDQAQHLPDRTTVFIHNAHRFTDDVAFVQGVSNLRDVFKRKSRCLVLLSPHIDLPMEIVGDIIPYYDELPTAEHIESFVRKFAKSLNVDLTDTAVTEATRALVGLPIFQVEQVIALSITRDGLVLDQCWELKRSMIEETGGLSVYRDGSTFADIAGHGQVKKFISSIFAGPKRPDAIWLVDEIEKALAGYGGDNTGVTQDQVGHLLTYMERKKVFAIMMIGIAGSGKSAIAESAGVEFNVPTIQMDLGGMKQKELGESEANVRRATQVISAVANDNPLMIVTANSTSNLPEALLSRFAFTFYFDLPDKAERERMFEIHMAANDVSGDISKFDHSGWNGRNVQRCCLAAAVSGQNIEDVAGNIVPAARQQATVINESRRAANGNWLDSRKPGVYTLTKLADDATAGEERKVELE